MEYRTLGRTGLTVSRLGFGGAPIGLPGYLGSEDRDSPAFRHGAIEAVRQAVACGVTYFDTAPGYGDGRSEAILGQALEGRREQVVLATKFAFGDDFSPGVYTGRLQASLARLRTERVEILQLHGGVYDDELAGQLLTSGVLDWADEMRARGRCRFLGLTAEGPSGALERLLASGRFDVLSVAYSLIYQSTCDYQRAPAGVIPLARRLGLGVTTIRPTTCGFLQKLFAAEFPEIDPGRLTRLAIRFALSTPEADCVLVGMKSAGEVRQNAALASDPAGRLDLPALHDRYAGGY